MRFEEEIKTSTKLKPSLRAGLNIMFTSYWLHDHWNAFFKGYDLTQQQYNVLRILRGQRGQAINLKDVQHRMIERNSNTTRLVEKLRKKGLVEQIRCEKKNRRKVEIFITAAGLQLLDQINPQLSQKEKELFNRLSDDDAIKINQILNKLRH